MRGFPADFTHEQIAEWLYEQLGDEVSETIYFLLDKYKSIREEVNRWDWS